MDFIDLGAQFGNNPLAVACAQGGHVVYVTEGDGDSLRRSENAGTSFVNLGAHFGSTPLAVASSEDGTIVYVLDDGSNSLYRSDDSGQSFTDLGAQFSTHPYAVACSADGTVVYVVDYTSDSLYRSDNSGQSFTDLGAQFGIAPLALACSADGTTVYVLEFASGAIFRSYDSGVSFTNEGAHFGAQVQAVACSATGEYVLVLARGTDSLYASGEPTTEEAPQEPPTPADPDAAGVEVYFGTVTAADVWLQYSPDGGQLEINNGVIMMTSSIRTALYLSMFGGADWWGNLEEDDPLKQYNATTQAALETLPPTSRNLRRVEEAAKADLAWLITAGAASTVDALATIPALGQVQLTVTVRAEGLEETFEYTENWKTR